jgi:hypothetical protein
MWLELLLETSLRLEARAVSYAALSLAARFAARFKCR